MKQSIPLTRLPLAAIVCALACLPGARRCDRRLRERVEALAALMAYDWPGNVRELEHAIERAADLALFPSLPKAARPAHRENGPVVPGASLEDIERDAILKTLEAVGGSTSRAAAIDARHDEPDDDVEAESSAPGSDR